jgi:hypothetical protein
MAVRSKDTYRKYESYINQFQLNYCDKLDFLMQTKLHFD